MLFISDYPLYSSFTVSSSGFRKTQPQRRHLLDELDFHEFHPMNFCRQNPDLYDEDGYSDCSDADKSEQTLRDLSAWRITIPRVESVQEPETKKRYHVFVIDVRRLDTLEGGFCSSHSPLVSCLAFF